VIKTIPISVSGGYWTGSSAVVDLLAEHSQCSVVPHEFTLFSFGQFFMDLYDPLIKGELDINLAKSNLQRFDAFNRSDMYPIRASVRHICRKLKTYPEFIFRRRSGMGSVLGKGYKRACNDFSAMLKQYLKSNKKVNVVELNNALRLIIEEVALAAMSINVTDKKYSTSITVFDQIIAPPYQSLCNESIPNFRFINVDRHWKDQYISLRRAYKGMSSVNDIIGVRPWNEDNAKLKNLDPINYFVELRTSIDRIKRQQQGDENVLWIDFEDLVHNRDETANIIFSFFGVKFEDWTPDTHFYPDISKSRVQKWRNPKWKSIELDKELQEIATRLGYEI
jgi:hypothetical protein